MKYLIDSKGVTKSGTICWRTAQRGWGVVLGMAQCCSCPANISTSPARPVTCTARWKNSS